MKYIIGDTEIGVIELLNAFREDMAIKEEDEPYFTHATYYRKKKRITIPKNTIVIFIEGVGEK